MRKTIISVFILVALAGAITTRYAWIRVWRTTLTADGLPVSDGRVYRNWSGDVLVDLRPVSGSLYVVRQSTMAVGIPNASSIIESPAVVFAREYPLRVVDLRSGKVGRADPRLLLASDKLSFIAADGRTILVKQGNSK